MVKFEDQIVIQRKPDNVYAFLAQAKSIMTYAPYFDRVEAVPPGELQTGSTVIEYGQFRGGLNQTQWTVTYAKPNERIVFETSNPLSKLGRVTFQISPVEVGTNLAVEVVIVARGIYRLAEPFIKRRLVKLRKTELGRIKQYLENEPGQ